MKSINNPFFTSVARKNFLLIAGFILKVALLYSQGGKVSGKVIDHNSGQPVSYASIALFEKTGNKPVSGTLSDIDGGFILGPVPDGSYRVVASFLGYRPATGYVEVVQKANADAGILQLQDTAISLADAIVVGEKAKAKIESNKTAFLVSQKMVAASVTGTDILKQIPGIQVDLMQNISVEGSRDIVIYVDGKERDKSYVSQLSPDQIDKIEIISVPTANYDGVVSKALNIVLKENRDSGFSGQISTEIPVTSSIIYVFPAVSMNYGYKKINLYTSYKGEIAYMDLHESLYREVWMDQDTGKYISSQFIRQKNQNHRFTYGFDYFITSRDVLNFYAYCNPYMMNFEGTSSLEAQGVMNDSWLAEKDDKFRSTANLYSLFYKHAFEKPGNELKIEISGNTLRAKGTTAYADEGATGSNDTLNSRSEPGQKAISIKIDYSVPAGKNMSLSTGVKAFTRQLTDYYASDFRYAESVLAAYGSMSYKREKYEINAGLRAEESSAGLQGSIDGSLFAILPDATFRYRLNSHHNLQASYYRTIRRPDIYKLNPSISWDDPVTMHKGNPSLSPEFSDNLNLEYSVQAGNNYFSSKLIYLAMRDVINNLTTIDDAGHFEIQPGNLGTIRRYGLQLSGAFRLGILSLNPYVLLYKNSTSVNDYARMAGVVSRNQLCLSSSLSAVLSFKKDFALSSVIQYNTPQNNMQDNYFCDALYFVSFDKTFRKKLKAGIGSGLMFTRSFIYNASDTDASDFRSCYRGYVTIPSVPLWLRISYQFNSGHVRKKVERDREDINVKPEKGF